MNPTDDARHDLFLRLFTANEPVVRAFVRSLVPTLADANDVMQEVAIVLWRKFGDYDSNEDFRRWAFGVAKFKVLAWQRDQARDRHVFGEDMTNVLAEEAAHRSDQLAAQREALRLCLDRLPAEQRQLVDAAYASGSRMDVLAASLGRTAMSLYKTMHRIRMALVDCTRRVLAKEEAL
jgi:RNA polymerase sigma-70 factor (ECF subfamily)